MSNPLLPNRDLDRVLHSIVSGEKKNLQNISFFNSPSASSFHQETENSASFSFSTIDELCQIFASLTTAQESRCKPANLAFYCINWETRALQSFASMLENNNSRIEHVEFQKNVFGAQAMFELSEVLGRNKTIRSIILSECNIESTGARLIASALSKNDTLEELQIWEDSIGSNGAEELSRMIEMNPKLKLLLILDRHSITAIPLISAVLARNRNVEVHIWSRDGATAKNQKIVEFVPETGTLRIYKLSSADSQRAVCSLGWNTTVKTLDMSGIHVRSELAKALRQVLEQNRSIREVKLSRTRLGDKAAVYIAAGLFKNESLEKLALDGNRFGGIGVEHLLCPLSRFSASQNQANTALKSVSFGGPETRICREGVGAILRMLGTNQTVSRLSIMEDASLRPGDVVSIFKSLETNATLRYLSLRGCKGVRGESVQQTIMGTLQVNPWIEEIDLTGTPLQIAGKTGGIYDKLGSNASLVPENELLEDMPLAKPKCCRVFFCGQDLSGKSTLCSSIHQNFSSSKVPYMDHIRTLVNPVEQITRIEQVKIKSIQDGETKISIWNLAGQHENFTLHDIMFPSHGSPSFFFIVSSLFRNREPKSPEEIEGDLLYWLRFIVSNSRRGAPSQSMLLPHITVVLTHSDKVSSPAEELHPALNLIQRLKEIFQGFAELYPTAFMVDARSSVSVSKLAHHMRKISMTVLQRAPRVYQMSNDMIEILSKWRSDNRNKPAMKWSEFCELCQLKVPSLRIRSRRDNMEKVEKKRQAVANSLQHVGEVIFFQELGYLILDCMWFFGKVLGQLAKLESRNVNATNNHGFLSWLELEKMLRGRLRVQIPGMVSNIFDNLEAGDLIRMMLKLELCYEQDPGNPKTLLLIPSILKEGQGKIPTSWQESTPECVYVGQRLGCQDMRHMFLTTGFFPRLQVHLHNKLVKLNEQKGATYALEKSLIYIIINGIQVRVEFGARNGYYVDVLACSNKTVTEVLRLFSQFIRTSIQSLCPGMTLSENVIRPDCVKYLIPPAFRRNQLVSILKLKEALLSMPAQGMYDYQHTWSSVFNGNRLILHSGFDYARNLLSDDDFREVMNRRYCDLHHLATELTVSFEHPKEPQILVGGNGGEQRIEPSLLGIAQGVELVLQRLKIIEQEIKDLKQEIQGLRYYEHCVLAELHRKVDYLVNYSIQLEERKVPNMFYFVQVQNYSKRLVTRIISGMTALRLHMLCEYRSEMHVVEEQEGCELLQIDNDAVKCLLPYMSKFMKLLTLALKIGAHFAAGMGEMIPDLGREVARLIDSSLVYGSGTVAAGAIGAAAIRQIGARSRNPYPGSRNPRDEIGAAQQWLVDFLKDQRISTGKDIADRFSLWRVRYLDSGHIAWICRGHKETRRKEITELPV